MAGNPLASLPGLPQRPSLARSSASETRLTQPGIEAARSRKLNSAPTAAFRFNAPGAGAIFVLEELVRRFELRVAIAALGASATAISVSRMILGDAPDFHLGTLVAPGLAIRPLFFVLGALAGVMAVIYN